MADLIKQAHASASKDEAYKRTMKAELARLVAAHPPYWSKVWPAGLALGLHLLDQCGLCARKTVLELGAGIGIGAVCAAMAGAQSVVVTDIEPRGLQFARRSAEDNGVASVASTFHPVAWDWNQAPPSAAGGPFDVALAGAYAKELARPVEVGDVRLAKITKVTSAPGG